MVDEGQHRIGEILTQHEMLTPTGLHSLLSQNFNHKLESLFTWEEGEYHFDQNDEFGPQDYSFSLSPARIVLDAALFNVSDEVLSNCLAIDPKLRPYMLDSDLWNDEELSLSAAEFRFVKHLRAHLSVGEILDRAGVPIDIATRLFTAFYILGMIGFEPAPLEMKRPVRPKKRPLPRGARSRIARSSPPPHRIDTEFARIEKLDYFALLEVDVAATQIDFHRAFRNKIKPYHFDVLKQFPLSLRAKGEEVVRVVSEAYLTLVNEEHRQLYRADLEDSSLSLEDTNQRARMRREGVLMSPIPTSPVSTWEMSPPPKSPFPQTPVGRLLTPVTGGEPSGAPTEDAESPEVDLEVPDPARRLRDAKVALSRGETDEAIALLSDTLDHYPDEPLLLAWHGWALFCQDPRGRAMMATMDLEAALQADPGLPDVHLLFARIAEYQGDLDVASKRYRFVALSPRSPSPFQLEAEMFENRSLEAWRKGSEPREEETDEEERRRMLRSWLSSDRTSLG